MTKMPFSGPTKVDKFFRKRDVSAAARNLAQLTADPTIFLLIHKHFARLLTLGKADKFRVNFLPLSFRIRKIHTLQLENYRI
jgi:hypothetical protein